MATLTPPPARNLEQDRSRVRSPLARVRATIYRYVGLEGLAVAGLFLTLWFWIGLALDYGVFKLFLFDWVQETPWAARLTALLLALSALAAVLATTVVLRLFREFSDVSMALVLERRFPEVLGDRLITAVELADPQAAAAYGYSPAMVRETIHEAADRVATVPVGEVFDWRRLARRAALVCLLTLGLYAVVGGGFALARSLSREGTVATGYGDFNEVAGIWAERNVLLRNTIWPRRSYLEVLPFDGAGALQGALAVEPTDLRIVQGTQPPTLRVRAWKYILADVHAAEGWRLLTWKDLDSHPAFLAGAELPALPDAWKPRDADAGMTVDEVELMLDQFPIRRGEPGEANAQARWALATANDDSGWRPLQWADLNRDQLAGLDVPGVPGAWDPKGMLALIAGGAGAGSRPLTAVAGMVLGPKYVNLSVDEVEVQLEKAEKAGAADPAVKAVRGVFDRLGQLAALRTALDRVGETASDRSMRRVVRKLIVPQNVTLTYRGLRSTSTSVLTPVAGNEFTGNFSELKENVSYNVRGEDYVTPRRTITVVERPRVDSLESEEERPAYLYYLVAKDGAADDLRLKRQPLQAVKLSVSGDTTTVEVPAGTHLLLRGTLSKPLFKIDVAVEAKDARAFTAGKPVKVDEVGFTMALPDVRREQKFKLVFTDEDGVTGERKVVVSPRPDTTPRVREFNPDEVIRKGRGNEGYIIAAGCRVPFKGRVGDDHGLARVYYSIKVTPADFLSEQKLRGLLAVGAVPLLVPGGPPLQGAGYLTALSREMASAATEEAGPEQTLDLPAFDQAVARSRMEDGRPERLERGTILAMLASPQKQNFRRLTRDFVVTADRWSETFAEKEEDANVPSRWYKANDFRSPLGCDLPLWKLKYRDREGKDRPLKDPDDTKPQKRFMLEVRLLVDDNFLDGEVDPRTKLPRPNVGASGEAFTFTVVPENELLGRIAEEEEVKFREMDKAVKPLRDNLGRLSEVNLTLLAGSVEGNVLTNYVARCDTLADVLKTSEQDVKAVAQTYERIVKEMRINQLSEDIQAKVFRTIYLPLAEVTEGRYDEARKTVVSFDKAHDSIIALRRALDDQTRTVAARTEAAAPAAAKARTELTELVNKLNAILVAMEGLAKINDLIRELTIMERQEEDLESLLMAILRRRVREAIEGKN